MIMLLCFINWNSISYYTPQQALQTKTTYLPATLLEKRIRRSDLHTKQKIRSLRL
ncbi:hypothetical protein Hanom_Chr04g00327561 [Helianthus anomalus]